MSAKEIKALARRWFGEVKKGKAAALAVMDELYAADYVLHSGTGEDIRGLKDNKQDTSELFSAFTDIHFTIDDMVAEGDKVAVRWTMTGTHKGEFMGIAPTNKKVTGWAITIYRIAGGKFVEEWARYDTLGLMQQLGIVPTPEKGKK